MPGYPRERSSRGANPRDVAPALQRRERLLGFTAGAVPPHQPMRGWLVGGEQVNCRDSPMLTDSKDRISLLRRLLAERILVLDGAMGTSIQTFDLTADDFGGPGLEGRNENLVLSRP